MYMQIVNYIVQITVGYKKPQQYILTGSAKKVGKSLARGKKTFILQQLLKNQHHRSQALAVSSDNKWSRFAQTSIFPSYVKHQKLQWRGLAGKLWLELQHSTPLLISIIEHFFPRTDKLKPLLCTCVAMLLKWRQPKMCHVQAAIHLCCKQAILASR